MSWNHTIEFLDPTDAWNHIPVELDFAGAVTLVATVAGEPERSDIVDSPNSPEWGRSHEAQMVWWLMDSLDQRSWYRVSSGLLTKDDASAITRVSFPVGTALKFAVTANYVHQDWWRARPDRKWEERNIMNTCGPNCVHEASLLVRDIVLNLAVRVISEV